MKKKDTYQELEEYVKILEYNLVCEKIKYLELLQTTNFELRCKIEETISPIEFLSDWNARRREITMLIEQKNNMEKLELVVNNKQKQER
jgi:hypothetical protein